jgi:hypothetical protein
MSSSRHRFVCALAITTFASLLPATPATAQSLFVTSTVEHTATNQLSIKGGPFVAGARVFLALVELNVVSIGPAEIVANLGSSPAGSHWLIVFQPAANQVAQFWTTIGAARSTPTQGAGATVYYTGNGWVLESLNATLFRLQSTSNGGPRAFSIVFPIGCTGTPASSADMTTNFLSSSTAGEGVYGTMCAAGASLVATVWDTDISRLTQIRCIRTGDNASVCQRFD